MKKISMQHAMEKITKAAARKAVAEQAEALAKTGKAVAPPALQSSKVDARSVVLGFDAAPEVAPDAPVQENDGSVPPVPPITKHSAEDVVYSSMLAAKERVAAKLKTKLDKIKPVSTWEQTLAAADQKAQTLAKSQSGAGSPRDLYRAKMLHEKMAAEERKLQGKAANAGYDPTAPLKTPVLNAHAMINSGT